MIDERPMLPQGHADSARAEWRSGWPVVLASAGGVALSTTHIYSLGIVIAPLEAQFGWSRAQISAGLLIGSLIAVFSSPFVGLLIDRVGPRRIALAAATAYCGTVALLGLAGPSIWSWFGLWVLLALAVSGMTPTIWTYAVSGLFTKGRGLALAVTLCGTGIGSSFTPLIASHLNAAYGWRATYLGLGVVWAVVILPLLFLLFTSRADRIRTGHAAAALGDAPILTGLSAHAGFRSLRFYKLALAAVTIALVAVSFAVNMVPILAATGLSRTTAADIASVVGIASIVGRLGSGYLLDRISGHIVAAGSVLLPIGSSVLLLSMPGSVPVSITATAMLGLSLGAELDAVAYLATRHLGLRSFGVLFGTISGLLSLATGLGPMVVNYSFDVTRSYDLALWCYIPLCLLAAASFLSLGRYPDHIED